MIQTKRFWLTLPIKTCSWSREQLQGCAEIQLRNTFLEMILLLKQWMNLGRNENKQILELLLIKKNPPTSILISHLELSSISWWGLSTWFLELSTFQSGSTSCLSWQWLDPTSFLTSWFRQPNETKNSSQSRKKFVLTVFRWFALV